MNSHLANNSSASGANFTAGEDGKFSCWEHTKCLQLDSRLQRTQSSLPRTMSGNAGHFARGLTRRSIGRDMTRSSKRGWTRLRNSKMVHQQRRRKLRDLGTEVDL
ncbi:hypothetical protein Mp_zg00870 [Marchantia polymorpha subsp. ruderalis]|uniref:Uncharacterized protein n=2 Tax=Marchantia polymorpha TaxID=3197 RepID=A0A679E5Y9_MARPO|nr:hypothetical protein MARPO_0092s0001 [Marchantia polymorpha]BBN20744.1 hypothetical protein Mp_zg00870 [Marchantia polymorpha subsp. ruderalis]|eukprot:PTQ33027.1 hypothetical protein MARPO_0092s0001 [Marchantia polymorpha]